MRQGMVRDRKTGKLRRVDRVRSRIAKRAARKRKGKKLRAAIKNKIRRSLLKVLRSGRTKFGRRSRLHRKRV